MLKALTSFLFFIVPILLIGQSFSGQIIDAKTNSGLAYVNIGVVGKNIGTVSAPDGTFSLSLHARGGQDSANLDAAEIKISMVGYESLSFSVSEFKKKIESNSTLLLQPTSLELDEIVVMPKFTKTKVLGNTTTSSTVTGGFSVDTLGREAGILVRLKKKFRPAQILKFKASVAHSDYDTIRFRLNLYDLKSGLPNQKLVQENIIITSTISKGVIEVNLEDYQILVEDDFCVTLEWIEDFGDEDLNFSFRFGGNKLVYRPTSQANWEDFRILSPGFNVEIGY